MSSKLLFAVVSFAVLAGLPVLANPAHEKLSRLSESDRRVMLAAVLARSGEACSTVSKTFYQGSDKKGNAFWNAACLRGDSFVIQVNNDSMGSMRTMSCKVLKAVGGGTCFAKF